MPAVFFSYTKSKLLIKAEAILKVHKTTSKSYCQFGKNKSICSFGQHLKFIMAEQQIISAVASSSDSSFTVSPKKYDVFLSFRGKDTRMNFTSHLHEALKQKGVETYIDYRLEKGDEISPALIKAIQDSHVSVVILSKNYASSKWCLEELSKIIQCRKNQGQVVKPVFYRIDPSHVRKQTGSYKKAFAKHEGEGEPRCNKWKAALTEVANLAGWDSRNRIESELLKDIVGDILQKLTPSSPSQLKGLVGIEENLEEIESLLKIGSGGVRILGIWGMGGIGKTTLATALYAKLFHQFEVRCFLADVRENAEKHGLKALRSKLFSQLLENENHCFDAPKFVPNFVKRRLGHKKALIVLDDVTILTKLEHLIGDYDLFGPGSRVIVTTRDKQIFRLVEEIYEVKELSFDQSLQLFCLTVFEGKQPKHGYDDLSRSAVFYCKGVPLALKVLGASLRRRKKEAWESELKKLAKIPNAEIHDMLKLSYDGLDDDSIRDVFLDIACFFKGEDRDWVIRVLDACEFFAISNIEVLLDRALVKISPFDRIEMHDLIQQMGREVVRQESIKDPGKRSRLWKHEEVHEVLKHNKGTEVVQGIALDLDKLTEDLYLESYSFSEMTEMRFLKIHGYEKRNRYNVHLPNGLELLSDKLRYLHWDRFCLESLPSNFCAEQLVELCMRNSKIKKLWDGIQNLVNLKTIDLFGSQDLIEMPDLSKAEKLETVDLDDCKNLRQLHPSMSSLPRLTYLGACNCKAIERLNVHSKYLRKLDLYGCASLKELSVTSEELTDLSLPDTNICVLSSIVSHNRKLIYLCVGGCKDLDMLSDDSKTRSITAPNHSGGAQHNAWTLSSIQVLLSLKELDLNGTNVESLPANIKFFPLLESLNLNGCRKLVYLPELPPSLKWLCLNNCRELLSLPELPPSLLWLHLDDCRKLVSLPELPPSLREMKSSNCTFIDTDFTQQLVLQHMLHQELLHGWMHYDDGYFMFPGDHIMDECGFRTTGNSVTIPCLPLSNLWGFIYCIILSKGAQEDDFQWSIYQHGEEVDSDRECVRHNTDLISDHVLFFYVRRKDMKMWHVFSKYLPFNFEFVSGKSRNVQQSQRIKECGVFPVYASKSGFKLFGSNSKEGFESESITQISDNESQPRGIGVEVGSSSNENEMEWEQLLPVITSSVFF